MGCAPIAHVLFSKIMRYNPAHPKFVRAAAVECSQRRSALSRCRGSFARLDAAVPDSRTPPAPQVGRDRFVLSNGHACALLYSMLHLAGYDLSIDELKRFRKLGAM